MARVDDYINAKKIAAGTLSKFSFNEILKNSGFKAAGDNIFRFDFLDKVYRASFPDFEFQSESKDASEEKKEIPLQEQVLIMHYMMAKNNLKPAGNWISYREIPGASFYFSAFVKRAVDPLKKVFGHNIDGFKKAAKQVNAVNIKYGDEGFEFKIFPRVPIQLILWEEDDEFPAEANILFDENIREILSPEDVAWMSGMLVYRLMALSR